MPFSVREGINIFIAGYVPTENMRFRDFELSFRVKEADSDADGLGGKKLKELTEEEKKKLEELKKRADYHLVDVYL